MAGNDPMLCAPCRVGDHRSHTEDGCHSENNFNAECECPVIPVTTNKDSTRSQPSEHLDTGHGSVWSPVKLPTETCGECEAEDGWHRTACSRHPRFVTLPAPDEADKAVARRVVRGWYISAEEEFSSNGLVDSIAAALAQARKEGARQTWDDAIEIANTAGNSRVFVFHDAKGKQTLMDALRKRAKESQAHD